MHTPQRSIEWAETHSFGMLEFVRFITGIMLFAKGVEFISNPKAMFAAIHMQTFSFPAMALAHLIIPAHLVGGVMIASGLLTRLAAAVNLPILLAAVLFVDYGADSTLTRHSSLPFALAMLLLLAFFCFFGSGRHSADHAIEVDYEEEERHVAEAIDAAEHPHPRDPA